MSAEENEAEEKMIGMREGKNNRIEDACKK